MCEVYFSSGYIHLSRVYIRLVMNFEKKCLADELCFNSLAQFSFLDKHLFERVMLQKRFLYQSFLYREKTTILIVFST